MAEENKEQVKKPEVESNEKKNEGRVKASAEKRAEVKATELKPYVHIDTFLQTAVQMYGLSRVQANGFKARMNGKHYQRDEKIFLEELKQYLDLK